MRRADWLAKTQTMREMDGRIGTTWMMWHGKTYNLFLAKKKVDGNSIATVFS